MFDFLKRKEVVAANTNAARLNAIKRMSVNEQIEQLRLAARSANAATRQYGYDSQESQSARQWHLDLCGLLDC